ncbi:MAG: hypothetical protein ABEI78_01645, partial [Candidatus Nanohaloarchaea archaeon]
MNEVGVPYFVAKKLTIPEKITENNWKQAQKWLENGQDTHPGANYVYQ